MVIIIMGAEGAAKTTIGPALAAELGWRFVDAVDLPNAGADHASLRPVVARAVDRRESLVLACPTLSENSRDTLRDGLRPVRFVFLETSAALEKRPVGEALRIDVAKPVERILAAIRTEFGL